MQDQSDKVIESRVLRRVLVPFSFGLLAVLVTTISTAALI